MAVRKKSVKAPKSIWVVYEQDALNSSVHPGTGSIYDDPNEIGEIYDGEVCFHYRLVETTKHKKKEK